MLALLGVILLIACIIAPRSKIVFCSSLAYLWALFALNTSNADYYNYSGIYERIGYGNQWTTSHYEGGFAALCRFSYNVLGLNYQGFLILTASICTILLGIVILLYTNWKNQNYVIALFFVTIYTSMVCQYRFYIATLLSLIAIYIIKKRTGFLSELLFAVLLLGAFEFHRSAAFYLIFLCVNRLNRKQIMWLIPVIVLGILLLRTGLISGLISRFVPAYKMEKWIYADTNRSALGIAIVVFVRVIFVVIICYMNKTSSNSIKNIGLVERHDITPKRINTSSRGDKPSFYYKCALLCIVFLAMEVFDKDYERLFRVPLILSFFMFSEFTYDNRINIYKVPLPYIAMLVYYIVYIIYFNYSFAGWIPSNLVPVFTQNMLL